MNRRKLLYYVNKIISMMVLLFISFDSYTYAASATNVRYEINRDDKIIINYDLEGSGIYTVSVEVSFDGGESFPIKPITITGDVGENVQAGKGKQIVWDVFKDIKNLSGNIVVRIMADLNEESFQKINKLNIKATNWSMKIKRRFRIIEKSLIFPGSGQRYIGRTKKGNFITFLQIMTIGCAVGGTIYSYIAIDEYENVKEVYSNAVFQPDLDRAYQDMEDKYDKAFIVDTVQKFAIGSVATVYLYNLVDAVIIKPKDQVNTKIQKTRLKAFAKSLVFPGSGQRYIGRTWKGNFITFLQLITIGGTVAGTIYADRSIDEYENAKEVYSNAVFQPDLDRAYQNMEDKYDKAFIADTVQKFAIGSATVVYLYNLIDTIKTEPKGDFNTVKNSFWINTSFGKEYVCIYANVSF